MIQLIQPNFNADGVIGECEAYMEGFFGVTRREPTARAAWDTAQFKHPDEEPPAGVIVPMFWDYMNPEDGNNDGHVAAGLGDGRIQSSPWQQGTTHAVLPSRAELERIYSDDGKYPLTYLGWTEDISNVRVVQGGMLMVDNNMLNNLYQAVFNRAPDHPGADGYIGQPADVVLQHLLDSPEYANLQAARAAETQKVDDLTAANLKLTDQLQSLEAQPAQPVVSPDADLVNQVKENNSLLSQLLSKLGSIFK